MRSVEILTSRPAGLILCEIDTAVNSCNIVGAVITCVPVGQQYRLICPADTNVDLQTSVPASYRVCIVARVWPACIPCPGVTSQRLGQWTDNEAVRCVLVSVSCSLVTAVIAIQAVMIWVTD